MVRFTLASLCCLLACMSAVYVSCAVWTMFLGSLPFGVLCLIYLGAMFAGARSFASVWSAGR